MVFDTAAGELAPAGLPTAHRARPHAARRVSARAARLLRARAAPGALCDDGRALPGGSGPARASTGAGTSPTLLAAPARHGLRPGQLRSGAAAPRRATALRRALDDFLTPIAALEPEARRGWICGLGHGVLPGTPEASVRTFVETVRRTTGMTRSDLFAKYDVPVPRYTSYPTVPQWHRDADARRVDGVAGDGDVGEPDASLAVYVHVPFCESLCTFCGCNTVITRDHGREGAVRRAGAGRARRLPRRECRRWPVATVRQFHLGGGTPTFLSAASLGAAGRRLVARLPVRGGAFEGVGRGRSARDRRRRNSRRSRRADSARVSLGVQDLDPEVQRLVNGCSR